MSDTDKGEVLMYFMLKEGTAPIKAESESTVVIAGDKLMDKNFTYGNYFEGESFTFGIELSDDESGVSESGDPRTYQRWRALGDNQPKPDPPFQAEPSDVSITRRIDSSSPILLKHCLEGDPFDKVVMVKRARAGNTGKLSGLLRVEFSKVWIKAVEWEDNDTVKETIKFKYAAVKVTYVPRKVDGTSPLRLALRVERLATWLSNPSTSS